MTEDSQSRREYFSQPPPVRAPGQLDLVEELEHEGLLVRQDPHIHAIGHCQRCHTVLEPLVTLQWYVKMLPLAQPG